MADNKKKIAVEELSDLCSLSMRDELPCMKEVELELTSAERNACIGLLYNMFHSGAHSCMRRVIQPKGLDPKGLDPKGFDLKRIRSKRIWTITHH